MRSLVASRVVQVALRRNASAAMRRPVLSTASTTIGVHNMNPSVSSLGSSRFMSASAAEVDTTPAPKKRLKRHGRRKLNPIILTERGANRIKAILSGDNAKGAIGIRLGVKRRGCNGLSYTLNYANEKPEQDEEMEAHGVRVFIEPMALFSVVGTVMDYEETELASEFTFQNPNSKGECGCGESFNV
uniref:Core domain-containing protein n=1 Tax=Attheya septentrionalis TaxID=420275 RepID=A0A7S2XT99_9STRA|mmetsp:Transcript_9517/g.17279  ORF Transcript_9517/g.17279 Transcript_9517/m.17279 type:complete len:187 (+) Transcript_9517:221-781(+)